MTTRVIAMDELRAARERKRARRGRAPAWMRFLLVVLVLTSVALSWQNAQGARQDDEIHVLHGRVADIERRTIQLQARLEAADGADGSWAVPL